MNEVLIDCFALRMFCLCTTLHGENFFNDNCKNKNSDTTIVVVRVFLMTHQQALGSQCHEQIMLGDNMNLIVFIADKECFIILVD